MSKIEIILLILACLVPCVALIFVLPKAKKLKEKVKSKDNQPKVEVTPQKEEAKQQKTTEYPIEINKTVYDTSEFKNYLKNKQTVTSKPKRKKIDFDDLTMPYMSFEEAREEKEQNTFIQDLNLTPELYAMIMSGVFDKKF